jgi:4-hydroxybenzoate polyprenyltransferase
MIEKGFFKRMNVYLKEMFPLPSRAVYAVLVYTSFSLMVHHIQRISFTIGSVYHVIGVWSIFALLFIIRLMDELKDVEIDRELFNDRPLPSGRVLVSDVRFTLVAMMVLYLIPNIAAGRVCWAALVVLCYALLMFRYFFIPNILRRYLVLNLATHNPIIPLSLLYIVMVFVVEQDILLSQIEWNQILIVVAMFWSGTFAWEISRKIRSKEEENAYVTYSQIFGRVGAVVVAAGAQTVGFTLAVYLASILSFSSLYVLLMGFGYATTMAGHVHFLIKPNPTTSKLKPFAERYVVVMLATCVIEVGIVS